MKQKCIKIVFWVVAVILGSCSGGGRESTVLQPLKQDSLYYARGLQIAYYQDYTKVDIRDPWDTSKIRDSYILVDRQKQLPDGLPEGIVIRTPLERVASYTSVHVSVLEQLRSLDVVVGVCEPQYVTSKEVLERIASGRIANIGEATAPNLERIIDLHCDAIIASPYENSGYGAAEKLGIPIIEAADYMENHPLGRTEWVRFFGLLVGKGELADSLFFATMNRYNELKRKAEAIQEKPTVLLERKYGSSWLIPPGDSYVATMHKDAGGDYIFKDHTGAESTPISVEIVIDKAIHADYWLFKESSNGGTTYEELGRDTPIYKNFDAFKNRKIYICCTVGTPYYDDITIHPDWILGDFIHIYHPELLPDYQPRYYFKLE